MRETQRERLAAEAFDVIIVGGGINGAVSAAALAGRGIRVALVDRGDFAGQTSQASSNLAWGGFKYLESGEIGLVRDLCRSRNRLMAAYPSSVREIRHLTLIERAFRWHPFLLYLGALIYWLIGSAYTRRPRYHPLRRLAEEEPIVDTSQGWGGMEHSESQIVDNDARFVFRFVRSALDDGAACVNYVEALGATRDAHGWAVAMRDVRTGAEWTTRCRALVNACGPFADRFNALIGHTTRHRHVMSKGTHIIVRRLTRHRRVLSFFTDDGRPFFALPMGHRTVIGTTDTEVDGPISEVTDDDRQYLLDNINKRLDLEAPLTEADIIAERVGVRPLVVAKDDAVDAVDWLKLSRKHAIETHARERVVTIFGGKLTDCLNVGDEVVAAVAEIGIGAPPAECAWYGEPGPAERRSFFRQARALGLDRDDDGAAASTAARIWRRHGRHAFMILDRIRRDPSKAERLIRQPPYTVAELEQMAQGDMIVTLEDFLRRRTELAMVHDVEAMADARGLWRACGVLFGEAAEQRWRAYFDQPPPGSAGDERADEDGGAEPEEG